MYVVGWIFLGIFLFLFISYLVILYYEKKLFQPVYEHVWKPDVPYEDLFIDNKLHAWYFKPHSNQGQHKKTVLFCHGNYGNISHRAYIAGIFLKQKINVLLFDYSGFGHSKGKPSQQQICQDGLMAFDFLIKEKNVEPNDIIISGESLGGAVATYIAHERPCCQLILLSTFSSLEDVLYSKVSENLYFQFLVQMYAMNGTNIHLLKNKEWIKNIRVPLLIIHSQDDDMIPFEHAHTLYSLSQVSEKKLISIQGSHSMPYFSDEKLKVIFDFCLEHQKIHDSRKELNTYQRMLDKAFHVYLPKEERPIESTFHIKSYLTSSI